MNGVVVVGVIFGCGFMSLNLGNRSFYGLLGVGV